MSAFKADVDSRTMVVGSTLHGDGVVATEDVERAGDVLFEEVPSLFIQSLSNRRDNLICGGCKSFVGSLNMHIDVLTRAITRQDQEELDARTHCASTSSLGIGQFPGNKILSPVVLCSHQCGEVYCCEECRIQHWNDGHCILCTGCVATEDDSLIEFKVHAVSTNEIFLMIADLYARVCIKVEKAINEGDTRIPEEIASEQLGQYDSYVRQLWWDAAVAPSDQDPAQLRESLQELVTDSWGLLSSALRLEPRGLAGVLSAEYMSRTIGMFEQNNVGVRLDSPLAVSAVALEAGNPGNATFSAAAQLIAQVLEEEGEGDEEWEDEEGDEMEEEEEGEDGAQYCGMVTSSAATAPSGDTALDTLNSVLDAHGSDNIFPPLDGAAFFMRVCKINHSCNPNVRVEYVGQGQGSGTESESGPRGIQDGFRAKMVSLRPIADGEELVQSYIDQNLPYEERLVALQDYGFSCSCEKCQRQE